MNLIFPDSKRRPAYDLSSDIVDNPGNGSLLMLMVQSNLYNSRDAEILMNSYVDLLVSFSRHPDIPLESRSFSDERLQR